MTTSVQILGMAGSLRQHSHNKALLRAAGALLPEGVTLATFDLAPIPLYNEDIERAAMPESVQEFKAQIRAADALLFVTPEYNYSIPGVLKNAIDWASRPYGQSAFDDKPVAIMGAGGRFGTVRAQYHLRQTCVFLNMHPLNKPEVMVANAGEKFDTHGALTDEQTRRQVADLLGALAAWARRLRGE